MNQLKILSTILFCFFSFIMCGQEWQVTWSKQFGNAKMDYFTDVIEDLNSGYTVLGSTFPKGKKSYDLWLVRLNDKGDTIWTKTIGTDFTDIPKKIVQDTDGGYLLLGISNEAISEKLLLIKTDKEGQEVWRKSFDDEYYYTGEDIISDGDNGFLLVGSKSNTKEKRNRWFAKLDGDGKTVWEKSYKSDLAGFCKAVKKLPDGGFVIAGQIEKTGQKLCDSWITRLDVKGEPIWSSVIAPSDMKIWPECVCCTRDSFIMVVGWQGLCMNDINSENPIFDFDLSLAKLDKNGKVVWTKNIKREGSEGGNSVAIRPDGNFVIAGVKATSFAGKIGPWLLLVDSDGNEIGENLMRSQCNGDRAIKVINCKDGGILVIGPGIQEESNTRSNGWILKFAGL